MTSGPVARARLLNPASEVSAHYLVWEDGRIEQLVSEADRAWHAGRSSWRGETDMNSVSVGIEIINAGHDGGAPPYPDAQIEAVIALARDICERRAIPAARVLGHSDIAPERKCDPGEWFPWKRLAAAGVGIWPPDVAPKGGGSLTPGSAGVVVETLQRDLAAFGYACTVDGSYGPATACIVTAFQRHFRPARVDGTADAETLGLLEALIGHRPLAAGW